MAPEVIMAVPTPARSLARGHARGHVHIVERGRGSAVLVSSMSAQIVNVPQFQASYHASKADVSMLAQALGVEWAPRGVRVNAIAPATCCPR